MNLFISSYTLSPELPRTLERARAHAGGAPTESHTHTHTHTTHTRATCKAVAAAPRTRLSEMTELLLLRLLLSLLLLILLLFGLLYNFITTAFGVRGERARRERRREESPFPFVNMSHTAVECMRSEGPRWSCTKRALAHTNTHTVVYAGTARVSCCPSRGRGASPVSSRACIRVSFSPVI